MKAVKLSRDDVTTLVSACCVVGFLTTPIPAAWALYALAPADPTSGYAAAAAMTVLLSAPLGLIAGPFVAIAVVVAAVFTGVVAEVEQ